MTDIDRMYKRLTRLLSGSRKTLMDACREIGVDIEDVDDYLLEQHVQECSHCGIWGTTHRRDEDEFPVCQLCFALVGR